MSRNMLAALLVAVLASPAAASEHSAPFDPRLVERNLLVGVQRALVSGFDMVDANRDGYITRAELQSFAQSRGLPAHGVMNANSFERADLNQDGAVSREEFTQTALAAYRQGAGLNR